MSSETYSSPEIPKIAALPWTDNDVFAPNSILRSALFAAAPVSKKSNDYVKNKMIYSQGDVSIEFTGETFNQNDLDVWLGIMRLISLTKGTTVILETESAFVRSLNRSVNAKSLARVRTSITKLTSGMVVIKSKGNKAVYGGHLISEFLFDEHKKRWSLRISHEMIALFSSGNWSRIDWAIRKSLTGQPIATWLHGFYSSHKNSDIPIGVGTLFKMCGSQNQNFNSFKQKLQIGANLLSETCRENGRIFQWRIESNNFYVTHTLSNKKSLQLSIPVGETLDIEEL